MTANSELRVVDAIVSNPSLYHEAASRVSSADFGNQVLGRCFAAVGALLAEDEGPPDVVTVARAAGVDVSDLCGLLGASGDLHPEKGLAFHAAAIRNRARMQAAGAALKSAGERLLAETDGRRADALIAEGIAAAFVAGERDAGTKLEGMREGLTNAVKGVYERAEHPSRLVGETTGLRDLDTRTTGLKRGEMILVAGRPSMGKSILALNMAHAIVTGDDTKVAAFFSVEMPPAMLWQRLLAVRSGVPLDKILSGEVSAEDRDRLEYATPTSDTRARLVVIDAAGWSPLKVASETHRIARMAALRGRELVYVAVDYVQLLGTERGFRGGSVEAISHASTTLKTCGRQCKVAMVAVCQLNRDCERRDDKRPLLSDLRGSGQLEQDADVCVFMYRDIVYNKDADPTHAECIIAKQRMGATGRVAVRFDGPRQRFDDAAGGPP